MFDVRDWESKLKAETREENVKRIAKHLEKFLPSQGTQSAILKFSRNFEEDSCKSASSLHEYERKIKDEMAGIEKYDRLCEENPFTNRNYEGFLGAVKMTYTSQTVAAPPGQIRRDPEDITLEQSARTVLKRNSNLKQAVRRLLLEKALKKGNARSALFNAVKGLSLQKEAEELPESATQTIPPKSSTDTIQQSHAPNPTEKKNESPGPPAPQ